MSGGQGSGTSRNVAASRHGGIDGKHTVFCDGIQPDERFKDDPFDACDVVMKESVISRVLRTYQGVYYFSSRLSCISPGSMYRGDLLGKNRGLEWLPGPPPSVMVVLVHDVHHP